MGNLSGTTNSKKASQGTQLNTGPPRVLAYNPPFQESNKTPTLFKFDATLCLLAKNEKAKL